ncbi:MAG: YfhO family protein, partial [Clostridiales bacterium]|nr:YfhO family protein [Clostridiales bacterium]
MGEERDSGRDYDSGGESHVGNGADGGRSHGESRAAGDAGTSAGDVGNAGATGAITGNADAVGAGVTGATADAAAGDVGASGVARASGGRICAADIWLGALSFAAPAALLCVAFAVIGIYPFGPGASNTVIIIDNYHQYTPFLMEFGEMLRSGGSMFYSWNAGLGSNFLARFAYYLSSPLNVFSAFFGGGSFAEFVLALVLVRAGAAGLAFFAYLRAKFGSPGLKTAAFAMMYAMCAFFLAYYWNVMWFDCVAVFPLVALGLERLADRGRGLLYCLALAFTIVSNYFIAIMVCIYAALHYAAYYLGRDRGRPAAPRALAAAGRFALYSALAGGLSAAVTLPAFYGLLRSSAAGAAFPKNPRIYADMADVIANHLMMIKPSIMVGLPNIYCGVAALLLVPLYFANGRVAFREKLCSGLLLAFFLVSFNENQLDFLWHGTHFPNSLLFRFAFLYVFLALTLAYRALISLGGVREGGVFGCFAALAAFVLFAEARPAEKTTKLTVYISLAFALIHALILRWNRSCELSGELPGELSGELSGGLPGGLSGEPPGGLSGGPPSELSGGLSEGLSGGPSGRPPSAFSDGPPNGLSGGGRPPSRLSGGLSGGGRPRRALLAEIALFVFVGAEMTINAGYGIGEAGVFPKDSYLMSIDSVKPAVEWAEAREEGFERIEFAEHTTYNTPVVYGYKGISYYSSTSYVAVNDMFGKLGLIHSNAWYVYRSSTPVLNSMFAVKYLLSRDRDFDNGIYPLVRREGDVRVYENPYFLPVGFMVDEAAEGWDVSRNNPFLVQEDFVAKATGLSEPLFTRLELEQGEHGGMTVTGGGQDGVFRYAPGGSAGEMKAVHRITARGNAGALAAGGGAGDGATGSGPQ